MAAATLQQLTTTMITVAIVTASGSNLGAQAGGETFGATASVTTSTGTKTAPLTVVITRKTTEQERAKVADALRTGGTPAAATLLKTMADVGHIEIGGIRSPLKYAYERPVGAGRLVTVIAAAPIAHLGADLPGAKPKAGFDLALALLDLSGPGSGTGELAPAAKVRLTDAGAVQTEDYGAEVVRLTNVQIKK